MSGLRLEIHIKLLSDFHVGTGFGLARTLDDRLLKDANGQPYLSGSTVKALLLDAAERLLQLPPLRQVIRCDGEFGYRKGEEARENQSTASAQTTTTQAVAENHYRLCGVNPPDGCELDWFCPLCRIFGSTQLEAGFAFSAAYVSAQEWEWATQLESVLDATKKEKGKNIGELQLVRSLKQAPTLKAHYNRIDPRSGRAEDEKLFSFELGAAGTLLQTSISELFYPDDELARLQNWVLLSAASAFIEELGKRRRWGLGKAHFELQALPQELATALGLSQDAADLLDHLDKLLLKPTTTHSASVPRPGTTIADSVETGQTTKEKYGCHPDSCVKT